MSMNNSQLLKTNLPTSKYNTSAIAFVLGTLLNPISRLLKIGNIIK